MAFWKWLDRIEGGMASVGGGICLFAMMMITVISVLGRYVFHADFIPGAYNIIERIAFPLMVFWAIPIAHREGSFPRFDMLVNSLSPAKRSAIAILVLLVEICVFAVLLWYVTRFSIASVEVNREMQIGTEVWPVWPIILMIPLAFGLMLLEMFRLLWVEIRDFGRPPREHHASVEIG
ncbi:TRAP transporter small permease [Quisquiliibacterium transsilvanicum]|jgi:TRAP-type C4-dicarboxylate transport system permease small subunit|uniref:TRAP transporter small permease protein n=1 Tax=Quisquiliibacterium transsilvanicum TaxID=1549638 RepID=A0A7W8HGI0_9BURK|nr:TRAP transporter small permease [Quisquiliibacterium transsilvanicum]MBB5271417.1 TRAP-type C4-dicarboxylate transport system permease small subunit [Quisquiliibacterium transsilvanicum]